MSAAFVFHAWRLWLLAAGLWALWRIDIYFRPFAPCRYCKGTGWNWGSRSSARGLCRHGRLRVRFGARAAAERHNARARGL